MKNAELLRQAIVQLKKMQSSVRELEELFDGGNDLLHDVDFEMIFPMSLDDWEMEIGEKILELKDQLKVEIRDDCPTLLEHHRSKFDRSRIPLKIACSNGMIDG